MNSTAACASSGVTWRRAPGLSRRASATDANDGPQSAPRLPCAAAAPQSSLRPRRGSCRCGSVRLSCRRFAVQMAKLLLLRRDLDQQAFAQVARAHAGRIEMLHQLDGAAHQLERAASSDVAVPRPARLREPAQNAAASSSSLAARYPSSSRLPMTNSAASCSCALQAQSSQLPRQVIGQSRRLGEKVFKRGFFVLFILRLRAITGVKILLEVRSEIDLVEGILGRRGSRSPPAPRSRRSSRPATSSSIGTVSSISSRTGFSTISASIISFSSSLLSARTLTICIRPGVRIWRCETFRFNLGCSSAINGLVPRSDSTRV